MCIGCWEEYGSPSLISDKTRAAAALLRSIIGDKHIAGNMHIVVDDWNIEDGSIDFCLNLPGTTPEERAFLESLRAMSLDERASTLAIYDGYLRSGEERLARLGDYVRDNLDDILDALRDDQRHDDEVRRKRSMIAGKGRRQARMRARSKRC